MHAIRLFTPKKVILRSPFIFFGFSLTKRITSFCWSYWLVVFSSKVFVLHFLNFVFLFDHGRSNVKKESKSGGSFGRGKYVAIYRSSPSLVAHAIRSFTQDIRTRRGKKMDPMEEWDETGRNGIATRFSDVSNPSCKWTLQRDVCSRSWAPHFGLTGVHTRTQLTRRTFQQIGKIKKKEMNFQRDFFGVFFRHFQLLMAVKSWTKKKMKELGAPQILTTQSPFFPSLSISNVVVVRDDMFYWFVHFERWRECSIPTVWNVQIKKESKNGNDKMCFSRFFLCISFAFWLKRSSPSRQKDTDDSTKKSWQGEMTNRRRASRSLRRTRCSCVVAHRKPSLSLVCAHFS
jgi:hypothetical protein